MQKSLKEHINELGVSRPFTNPGFNYDWPIIVVIHSLISSWKEPPNTRDISFKLHKLLPLVLTSMTGSKELSSMASSPCLDGTSLEYEVANKNRRFYMYI